MIKKIGILVMSTTAILAIAAFLVGCGGGNPVQDFIDENRSILEESSAPIVETMGEGASVDFLAGDGEFIYVYTFGSDYPTEDIVEILESILSASAEMYETLAAEFADTMGIDALTITLRYYDAEGNYLISESLNS